MKPHNEAKRLIKTFTISTGANTIVGEYVAKQLALTCVKEIKNSLNNYAHGAAWKLETLIKKEEFWTKVEDIIKHI